MTAGLPDLRLETPTLHLEQESFQVVMHQNLARAPWLVVSLVLHAVALLVALMISTPQRIDKEEVRVVLQQPEEELDIPDEIEEPVEPPVEPELPEPTFEEVTQPIEDTQNMDAVVGEDSDYPDDSEIVSAFDNNSLNPTLGLDGGSAGQGADNGKYSNRGRGGPNKPEIRAALEWLAKHQDDNGRWDSANFMKHDVNGKSCTGAGSPLHDVGVTGLALLAFLGEGSTLRSGEYRHVLRLGIQWLRSQQENNGRFGTAATNAYIYDHCIATLAMCEAMGLSKYRILRPRVQRAINYLESHRNPYGTWRYQPRSGDNDTSVTGWALMALKSAKDFDLQVNDNAFKAVDRYFDEMTDPATGRCGYNQRGSLSSREGGDHAQRFPPSLGETLTAVGLFSRCFLGHDPKRDKVMNTAANTILCKPPSRAQAGAVDHYYWYYATYALYQMGGKVWRQWSKSLTSAVVKTQRRDGNFKGSWDPDGAWGQTGGRVYSTAILALTLQAYHRYARVLVR